MFCWKSRKNPYEKIGTSAEDQVVVTAAFIICLHLGCEWT